MGIKEPVPLCGRTIGLVPSIFTRITLLLVASATPPVIVVAQLSMSLIVVRIAAVK